MSKAKFTSGNEKHVVYKKTTKRGEGKIGDIMVNHPTKDKGTYDTISLTRTSNAKTIKQGIAAEKKWHADNPMKMLSGAKSVKQYRGDENLPEAKKGMKNCGCKHPKSKYRYGTGAVVIPEGSAIITAKDGLGKIAEKLHEEDKHEEVEKIINRMPEDKPTGKKYKYKKVDGADALELLKNPLAVSQATKMGAQYPWFKPFTSSNTEKGRTSSTGENTLLDPNDVFNQYNNIGALEKKAGRKFSSMEDLQGHIYDNMSDEQRTAMWKKFGPTLKSSEMTKENFVDKLGGARTAYGLGTVDKTSKEVPKEEGKTETVDDKKKPDFKMRKGFNIQPLAKVATQASILSQGVEGVPENYLKLGRYNYASQLDRTLRENAIAANTAKENIRDVSAGSAGSYLSNVAAVTGKRFEANAAAGTAEGIAKNELLNKNVDLGNTEATVNTGLKNQFAQQRAANRGAYNNLLLSMGDSIDSAVDASNLMSNQRGADNQRLAILKSMADSGNYDITTNPDGTMGFSVKQPAAAKPGAPQAKGNRKLKTYKRK